MQRQILISSPARRKKSNSFRVNTDTDTDNWSSPSSPVEHLDNPASPGTASAFRPMSRQLPAPNSGDVSVASPTSQLAVQGNSRQVRLLLLDKHTATTDLVTRPSQHLKVLLCASAPYITSVSV